MSRVLAVAVVVTALGWVASVASAHEGNPNFRSDVRGVAPAVEGVDVRVVNYDDSLELRNGSSEPVTVLGYRNEPYVRIGADGAVEVNRRSPTLYLNDDRYAEGVRVPASADPQAPPMWELVDGSGRYAWHDHRIHWMSRTVPPQVKDEGKRTKVFDWRVPLDVGDRPVKISGTLTWVGKPGGGFPIGGAISLVAATLAGLLLVVVVRRRRKGAGIPSPAREAW